MDIAHLGAARAGFAGPEIASIEASDAEAREGEALEFRLELSQASETPVSVDYETAEGRLTLDGEVVTGMLGADWTRGRWTTGLIVSHSAAEGGYSGAPDAGDGPGPGPGAGTGAGSGSGTGGRVEATLTGVFPCRDGQITAGAVINSRRRSRWPKGRAVSAVEGNPHSPGATSASRREGHCILGILAR